MTMDHPSVRACLAISGIYDLEPMRHCYVNDKLGLDEAMALRNSPIHMQSSGTGADHFSILDEMERGGGLIVDILRDLKASAGLQRPDLA